MDQIRDVELGLSTPRSGDLFPVCRRRPVWPLGRLWAAQCVVGQLYPIRRLYGPAQAETLLGLLLVLGWNTRIVALLSGALLITFALTMTVALGVKAPLNFSVFSAAGGALLLGVSADLPFSVDEVLRQRFSRRCCSCVLTCRGIPILMPRWNCHQAYAGSVLSFD